MNGHKIIMDNGEVDISLAVSVVLVINQIYNVAYPSQLKKTFSFLEAFILKLDTPTTRVPVAVQRVANALNVVKWSHSRGFYSLKDTENRFLVQPFEVLHHCSFGHFKMSGSCHVLHATFLSLFLMACSFKF